MATTTNFPDTLAAAMRMGATFAASAPVTATETAIARTYTARPWQWQTSWLDKLSIDRPADYTNKQASRQANKPAKKQTGIGKTDRRTLRWQAVSAVSLQKLYHKYAVDRHKLNDSQLQPVIPSGCWWTATVARNWGELQKMQLNLRAVAASVAE